MYAQINAASFPPLLLVSDPGSALVGGEAVPRNHTQGRFLGFSQVSGWGLLPVGVLISRGTAYVFKPRPLHCHEPPTEFQCHLTTVESSPSPSESWGLRDDRLVRRREQGCTRDTEKTRFQGKCHDPKTADDFGVASRPEGEFLSGGWRRLGSGM